MVTPITLLFASEWKGNCVLNCYRQVVLPSNERPYMVEELGKKEGPDELTILVILWDDADHYRVFVSPWFRVSFHELPTLYCAPIAI